VPPSHFGQTRIYLAGCVLAVMAAVAPVRAQSREPASAATAQATLQGRVRDSTGTPVANVAVFLQIATGEQTHNTQADITHTDMDGKYRFAALRAGAYTLRAEMNGYGEAIVGPVSLGQKEMEDIDLTLISAKASTSQNASPVKPVTGTPGEHTPEFFDEPQFTVAGVTQATNSGGHGSDTVLRTTEALAKATVSLSKESAGSSTAATSAATESSLRDAVAREPENFEANRQLGKLLVDNGRAAEGVPYLERASRLNPRDPELYHLLGDVEEKLGNPLDAVREYQRAAELDPSEPNLFDWGTELLTHRALEPATEVFTKGNRQFPNAVRMLIALGVVWYARGSNDQAAQCLVNASDLAPDNPAPYLFLGKMQSVEGTPSEGSVERLRRFAQLQPDNALANYYYAVSLWKQSASAVDPGRDTGLSARVESLLQRAVHLDPKLGAAYLQLGILYSRRKDFSRAISAYRKAIEVNPEQVGRESDETLEVAHYRLAQAYLRTGDQAKAQQELKLHDRLSKKTKENAERERRASLQFVISLQNTQKKSVSQPQP
jgi:tetratricopeptide (TPR) repeat protein